MSFHNLSLAIFRSSLIGATVVGIRSGGRQMSVPAVARSGIPDVNDIQQFGTRVIKLFAKVIRGSRRDGAQPSCLLTVLRVTHFSHIRPKGIRPFAVIARIGGSAVR